MKSTMKLLKVVTLTALLSPILGMNAMAVVIVSDENVTGNAYTYSVFYNDLTPGNPKIVTGQGDPTLGPDPGSTTTNFLQFQEGSGTRYLVAQSWGPNEIQYQFDFSSSTYRVKDVSITDRLTVFASETQTGSMTSQWSTDGMNWTTLRTVSPTSPNTADSFGTVAFSVSNESSLYYRVVAAISQGDPYFTTSFQWNRLDNSGLDNTHGFKVAFTNMTAVPEPSTCVLLILGSGLFVGYFLHRRRVARLSH